MKDNLNIVFLYSLLTLGRQFLLFRISLKGRKAGMPAAAAAGDIDFGEIKYFRIVLKAEFSM